MAIATLIIATLLLKVTGADGTTGMVGAIAIGGIICIVAGYRRRYFPGLKDRIYRRRNTEETADR